MYDFYTALEKSTDGSGLTKTPNRYREFLRMMCQWRHLMSLKRGRRGHKEGGVLEMQPGELACVRCLVCPRPGINLPEDWETAPPDVKHLYIMFIALNTCFRLKRHLISSNLHDPALGSGWQYFTEKEPYRKFLLTVTDQKEISTCSGLAALDYANTKFSQGYSATGVGMRVCARHEFVQATGVGDLQVGERFSNMDYIFALLCRHVNHKLFKVVSYDIACQWWKNLFERLLKLPPMMRMMIVAGMIRFVIPKLHIKSHTLACHILYSLNLLLDAARTDGEGIERPWSFIGAVAASTRAMGPGSRYNVLDDHWSFWNWCKKITIAALMRKRPDVTHPQEMVQKEAFDVFSVEQSKRAPEWKARVDAYNKDTSKPNPYEAKVDGLTEKDMRLQLNQEEKEQLDAGVLSLHDVSPSTFIAAGLHVEDQQCPVHLQVDLKKKGTTSQQIDVHALCRKLFHKLQAMYSPGALQALARRTPQEDKVAEDILVMLPSVLSAEERSVGCVGGVVEVKRCMRDAQCRVALVDLRNQLTIKSRLMTYKSLHSRHQGPNTRSQTRVEQNESQIRLHSEKYQFAWRAALQLVNGDAAALGWRQLKKEDIWQMESAEELTATAAVRKNWDERLREAELRLVAEGEIAV
ncbi:hypothetical protein C8J57DRAFT_1431164 [Mycena rebaudengoi]|nr:hypothetical protein C8J57DRAFT_1431164 [Mycena rebaudengoi]